MKVYVAGPMRGYDRFNFPAFDAATEALRAAGHDVRSPAEHDRDGGFDETLNSLDGFDLHAAFRWDIESVLWADVVVLLDGWWNSERAQLEATLAEAVGTPTCHPDAILRPGPNCLWCDNEQGGCAFCASRPTADTGTGGVL